MSQAESPAPVARVRLDAWLDVACLFKTRSLAQRACRAGQVEVNGQAAKPNRLVQAGDEIAIARGSTRRQLLLVRSTAEHHVAKPVARQLYEDRTPPPTEEQLEERRIRRLLREVAPAPAACAGRPEGPGYSAFSTASSSSTLAGSSFKSASSPSRRA